RDVETEAAFRARADADRRGHRSVGGDLRAALGGHELHGADEAGGVAGREELLGIIAGAATAAEFLRGRELDVERAVQRRGVAVATAGGLGLGLVVNIHGHGSLPRFEFPWPLIAHNSIVYNINSAASHLIVRN